MLVERATYIRKVYLVNMNTWQSRLHIVCVNSNNFFMHMYLYMSGIGGRLLAGLLHGSSTGHALTLYALSMYMYMYM